MNLRMFQIVRQKGPVLPKEDEPRGILAPLKEHVATLVEAVSPANITREVSAYKGYTTETLMENRGPGFLAVVRFGSFPFHAPPLSCE
jgi:hypothetical protein